MPTTRKSRLTFAQFMDFALYDPERGYYAQSDRRIGKSGDFVTGPATSPLFGQILADAILELIGQKLPQSIVEFGGGQGYLADDILQRLRWHIPYYIIERTSQSEKEKNRSIRRVKKLSQIPARPLANSIIIANEFLDALPFHRVMATQEGLRELYVANHKTNPREACGPLSTPKVASYFKRLGHTPLSENRVEVSLAALDWLSQIRRKVKKALIFVIDYGRDAESLLCFPRPHGTIRCFYQHQVDGNPFEKVGQKDITADVNWTAIEKHAEQLGFKKELFLSQGRFLMRFGQTLLKSREFSQKELLQLQTLVHPEWMGEAFQVLVLRLS